MIPEAIEHIKKSITSLLHDLSLQSGLKITFQIHTEPELYPYSLEGLAHKLAQIHGYTLEGLRQKCRTKHLSIARMSSMHLLKKYADEELTYNEIGILFNHDRSTVRHALNTAKDHIKMKDSQFSKVHDKAEKAFKEFLKHKK